MRLTSARLNIPPLRDRPEEILLLARRFLCECAERVGKPLDGFSVAAESKLLSHTYEANVRELRNVVERAVAMEDSDEVQAESIVFFSDRTQEDQADKAPGEALMTIRSGRERLPTLGEVEREYLMTRLDIARVPREDVEGHGCVVTRRCSRRSARHGLDVDAIVLAQHEGRPRGTCSTRE